MLHHASKIGWSIILVLSLLPVLFWVNMYSLSDRIGGVGITATSVGQILGLVGVSMFALNLILSARLRSLEGLFGGMNRMYIMHHILGGVAFVLLLLHPLALSIKYLVVYAGGTALIALFDPNDWPVTFGIIALGLMILFLVLTFFVKLPYHIWKLTHKFMGLAFFFASLHVFFIPSDISQNGPLRYYVLVLVALGLLAILYRTILWVFLVPRREFRVLEVKQANSSVVEIVMKEKDGKRMKFKPGQFVFVSFPDSSTGKEVHPFSLSSAPDSDALSIGVKALGDYTLHMKEIRPGERAIIEGPFGRTSYVYYDNPDQIWLAGGIGITPFLSMARSLTPDSPQHVDLYYSVNERSEAVFLEELEAIAAKNPKFRILPLFCKECGFYLSADYVIKTSGGVLGKEIFLCGPPPMMKSLKEQLAKLKVSTVNIHSEEFSLQ